MSNTIVSNHEDSLASLEENVSTPKSESEVSLEKVSSDVITNSIITLDSNELVDVTLQEKENPSNLTMAIDKPPNASPASVSFNLANSSIGAGILALPFAFKQSGYVLGLILLILFGIVADYTLQLLVKCVEILRVWDGKTVPQYENLGYEFMGNFGYVLVSVATIVLNYGACAAYLIILGDLMVPVLTWLGLGNTIFVERWFITLMLVLVFVLPLALLRSLHSLQVTSSLSMVAVLFFACMVVVYFFLQLANNNVNINNSLLAFNFTPNILVASPLFTFAFACHTTVLPAYHEMKVEKRHLMSRSIHVAVTMVFISYLIVGEFGYVTFSINTNENIITNYPQNSVFVNLIRIVMTLTIIWSFPMSSYPLRHTVNMLLVKCRRGYKDPNPKVGTKTNVIIIFILVASALCIAIFFPHIVAIFGLLGSTSLTLLAYMLPSFMYIKLRRTYRSKRYCSKGNVLPFLLGIIGFCFGIASTVVILRDLIASDNSLQ